MYEKFTFFTTGTFWFLMGILFAGLSAGAKVWFEEKGFVMKWWKWLLAALWWFLVFFTFFAAFTFLGEGESRAFWLSMLVFGIFDIILGVGLWRLLARGKTAPATD